jgi:hypothetical protein
MTTQGTHPADRFVGYVVGSKAFILPVKGGDRYTFFVPVDFADTREELVAKYAALGLTVA